VHSEAIPIKTGTMDGSIWKQELKKLKTRRLEISTTVIILYSIIPTQQRALR